jgi:hypothetical protein
MLGLIPSSIARTATASLFARYFTVSVTLVPSCEQEKTYPSRAKENHQEKIPLSLDRNRHTIGH